MRVQNTYLVKGFQISVFIAAFQANERNEKDVTNFLQNFNKV